MHDHTGFQRDARSVLAGLDGPEATAECDTEGGVARRSPTAAGRPSGAGSTSDQRATTRSDGG